jgi:hypothetical protein
MYSESEIQSAVAAGAIDAGAAAALRQHVEQLRAVQREDQEHFRFVTGFNDIFVSIAIVLLLVAAGSIGNLMSDAMSGFAIAATAWLLAEFFTRKRHMALPSILLVIAFAIGIAVGCANLLPIDNDNPNSIASLLLAVTGLLTAGMVWLHWLRFQVPITIAALTAAAGFTLVVFASLAFPKPDAAWPWLVLVAGLATFVLAMRWDISDRERVTRRSDVAFWLHLLAAPAIAHPLFQHMGVFASDIGALTAFGVFALYLLFGLVAVAIDRRAILVSGLAYVLAALIQLLRFEGNLGLDLALTTLIIGSALLLLSAFWGPIRERLIALLPPSLQQILPDTHRNLAIAGTDHATTS